MGGIDEVDDVPHVARAIGDRPTLAHAARWRATIARMRGDLDGAGAHVAQALELAPEPTLERTHALRELALLREAQGRPAEAREAYAAAGEVYRSLGSDAQVSEMEEHVAALA